MSKGRTIRGRGSPFNSILERLPEHPPAIVFEYSPTNRGSFGYHPSRIIDLLSSSGYGVYLIGDTGEAIATKTVDVHPMRHVNLVAAKDEKKLPLVRW